MNYLAGLILIGVNMQEGVAFTILLKLMEGEGFNLHELYGHSLKLLFEFSDCVYSWLLSE